MRHHYSKGYASGSKNVHRSRASSKSLRLRLKLCFLGVSGGFAARNTQKRIFEGGFAAPDPPPEVTLT
jgi:hypothetical protein